MRGTQWTLVTEFPRTAILAPAHAVLRRFAFVALALVAVGAAAAWALSRGITRPLGELTAAAEQVSAGDLSARVATGRADELGRLAFTFNEMGSSLGEAQDRLEQARAAAETANAVKGDFLATMSHEIRTPLNAILGYTDLMQIGIAGPLTEQQQEYLDRTQASGKHLLALLSDILDLSKIEAGGMEVRRERARASVAVESALALVLPQAAARGITIVNECDDSTSTRYVGDEGRVQQILANLLSNAVKFTNPGGRVTVRCSTISRAAGRGAAAQAWTTLQVDDTGVGIEPDRMAAVWEPFVQAEMGHTRAYGGTGLGLSISRRLARLMGGDLTAESTPGVGSTFTLWLPTAAPLAPDDALADRGATAHSYSAR